MTYETDESAALETTDEPIDAETDLGDTKKSIDPICIP